MPQMSPLSWTLLFITFLLIFIIMIYINYHTILLNMNNNDNNKLLMNKISNWKW